MTAEELALVAKALAHPARVQIIDLLAGQDECRGGDVFGSLPLAQSTVSQHLSVLREADVVHVTPVGTSNVYCLHAETLAEFSAAVSGLATRAPACPPRGEL
jgi:ArsR family transcriptional regulator